MDDSVGRRGNAVTTEGVGLTKVIPPTASTDLERVAGGGLATVTKSGHLTEIGDETPTFGETGAESECDRDEFVRLADRAGFIERCGVMVSDTAQLGLGVTDLGSRSTTLMERGDRSLARQPITHDAVVL